MKELRILCFGASLVEGFTQAGYRYTPYSIPMAKKLAEKLSQLQLKVDVDGKSGDMVTEGYHRRMERRFVVMGDAPSKPLHILCFGDSLTDGYSKFGLIKAPYSKTLKTELDVKFWAWLGKDKRKVEVVTDGVSGDLVTRGSFGGRMTGKYATSNGTIPQYNYTLFLGGTNDLGWGKPASEIWASIKTITGIPLQHGSKVLLMTVPECGVKNKKLDEARDELNGLIKGDGREDVYTFDLHAVIPYHSMSEAEQEEIWDDGLHLTPKGYERMGELVAARLMEIIESEEPQTEGVVI